MIYFNIFLIMACVTISYGMKIGNQKTITTQNYNNEIAYMDNTNEYDLMPLESNLLITEKINSMLILQNEFLKPLRSPGETSYIPISINAKGRLEIAVNVISAAIFILTLSIKLQETLNWDKETNYSIQDLSSINNKYSNDIEKLENGIKYTNEKRSSSCDIKLNHGDKLQVIIKLYYNGLELSYMNNNSMNIYEIKEDMPIDSRLITDKINIKVPFPALKNIINNIPIGSITKISIPPALAFGKEGFPPFVPADSTILCEILLQKIK